MFVKSFFILYVPFAINYLVSLLVNYLFLHILQNIAEMLRLDVPIAMKLAFEGIKDSEYKTRDTTISDLGGFENVELSVLLCNDEFIRKLNKEWRDEDHATDVLSMSQHIPELKLPIVRNQLLTRRYFLSYKHLTYSVIFLAAYVRGHCNLC